jgi:hypothetical protein
MTQRRVVLILVFLLFAIFSIVFVTQLRDVLREEVVEPIIGLYLRVRMVWRSLRSDVVWSFFWLFCVLLAVLIFPSVQQQLERTLARPAGSFRSRSRLQSSSIPSLNHFNRLDFWRVEIQQMYVHRFLARFTVIELKKLILEEIAFRENLETRHQAERWLLENPDRVPPAVLKLFNDEIYDLSGSSARRSSWLYRLLVNWGWLTPDISPVAMDRSLEAILAYLEKKPEAKR